MRLIIEVCASQLHGQVISDIWDVESPNQVLTQVLANCGKTEPEYRLLWVNGQDTVLACYHIGAYCDSELIGQSPGETVEIAQDMAARDALKKLFRFDEASRPVMFETKNIVKSDPVAGINNLLKFQPNMAIKDWSIDKVREHMRIA